MSKGTDGENPLCIGIYLNDLLFLIWDLVICVTVYLCLCFCASVSVPIANLFGCYFKFLRSMPLWTDYGKLRGEQIASSSYGFDFYMKKVCFPLINSFPLLMYLVFMMSFGNLKQNDKEEKRFKKKLMV